MGTCTKAALKSCSPSRGSTNMGKILLFSVAVVLLVGLIEAKPSETNDVSQPDTERHVSKRLAEPARKKNKKKRKNKNNKKQKKKGKKQKKNGKKKTVRKNKSVKAMKQGRAAYKGSHCQWIDLSVLATTCSNGNKFVLKGETGVRRQFLIVSKNGV